MVSAWQTGGPFDMGGLMQKLITDFLLFAVETSQGRSTAVDFGHSTSR